MSYSSQPLRDVDRDESMQQVLSELDNPLAAQSWPGGNAAFSLLLRVWLQE